MTQSLTHPNVQDGWFKETPAMWPGQAMTLEVEKILHVEKSQFQDVLAFQSKTWGRVLVLDGVIQATEKDEHAYQEMIAHIPLMAHPNPKNVLVIGGGDGGVLREVVKHPEVESVVLVDIDEAVPRVSKLFMPGMAVGFDSPKTKLIIGDGFEYLKQNTAQFDVIITDSSDPVGPAESLFGATFYQLMHDALRENGIICTQGESFWLHKELIKEVLDAGRQIFKSVGYAWASVPTYPCGQIGFVLASRAAGVRFHEPRRQLDPKATKYYSAAMHAASFVLPNAIQQFLGV